MYQPGFNANLGTSGHRASSSVNYLSSYDHQHVPPPTSSHFLPHQPIQNLMIQPTMVGIVPPPPLHIQNAHMMNMMNYQQQQQQHHQQQQIQQQQLQQQQPTTGGINSVLEYDLNNMSTFLSWCAFGMLKQNRNPSKNFESLVNSVLFATRLPKSTIIIALEYMNQRFSLKKLDNLSESDIFVKLIVSLILGNKFNDDNTFTNRSWCGATGLDLNLLNEQEMIWLDEVNWQLNVVNFESNIVTLEECWKTWLDKYSPSSPISNQPSPTYNSLPSSPVSPYSAYYPSSSPTLPYSNSSPNGSIWNYQMYPYHQPQPQQQQQPNIWSYTPYQYQNQNFVGYTNPYYSYNMASC